MKDDAVVHFSDQLIALTPAAAIILLNWPDKPIINLNITRNDPVINISCAHLQDPNSGITVTSSATTSAW